MGSDRTEKTRLQEFRPRYTVQTHSKQTERERTTTWTVAAEGKRDREGCRCIAERLEDDGAGPRPKVSPDPTDNERMLTIIVILTRRFNDATNGSSRGISPISLKRDGQVISKPGLVASQCRPVQGMVLISTGYRY